MQCHLCRRKAHMSTAVERMWSSACSWVASPVSVAVPPKMQVWVGSVYEQQLFSKPLPS